MRGETIARNYAEALFELAEREGEVERWGEALELIAGIVHEEPRVRAFLETPRIQTSEKNQVLRSAFEGKVPDRVLHFLLLVVDRRRQRLLQEITAEYRALLDERLGRAHVTVQVAREMDEDERARVQERLSAILGKEAILDVQVRPELLGGVVFRSGDMILDGSVRRRLQRMRRRLMEAGLSTE